MFSVNYFSLEDILATEERVSTMSKAPIQGLGFVEHSTPRVTIDSHGDGEHDPDTAEDAPLGYEGRVLPAGAKMELPIWQLAALLRARAPVEPTWPEVYGSGRRAVLRAEPAGLRLPRIGPNNFYETGRHLMVRLGRPGVTPDGVRDALDLGQALVEMLMRRFRYILDTSSNCDARDAPEHMERLDAIERGLYLSGQKSAEDLRAWSQRKTGKIQSATLVARHISRKRKAFHVA
jgi:GINS complex subunit 3